MKDESSVFIKLQSNVFFFSGFLHDPRENMDHNLLNKPKQSVPVVWCNQTERTGAGEQVSPLTFVCQRLCRLIDLAGFVQRVGGVG